MTPISRLVTKSNPQHQKSVTFALHNSLKTFLKDAAGPDEKMIGWWGGFRKA